MAQGASPLVAAPPATPAQMPATLAPDSSIRNDGAVAHLPSPLSSSPPLPKQQRKQQQRTATSLAFLERIERVAVTGTTYRDEREQVQFRVVMKDHNARAAQMSARKTYRDAKRVQPIVSYDNTKALSTLKSVHLAARQWSSAHTGTAALDGSVTPCAYCSQFTSPAALQLWEWSDPELPPSQPQPPLQPLSQPQPERELKAATKPSNTVPELTVVVNSSAASASITLRKIERCLNSYLESAQRMTLLLPDVQARSECQGCAHIPTLVASFLQNEDYSSVPTSVVLFACQIM